jgi:hypothetical protein
MVTTAVRRWNPFAVNAPWRLLVTLARKPSGFEGSAELRDVTGTVEWTRSFPATSTCADLTADLATAIGVRVDPVRPQSRAERSDPATPPAPLPPPPKRQPPPASIPEPVMFRLGAAGWMDLATAPRPAAGVSLDLGLQYGWFSVAIEGRWDPPAGATVATGATVTMTRFLAALVPCGHYRWLLGCIVGQAGQVQGTLGIPGGDTPSLQRAPYYTGGIRLGVEIPAIPSRLYVRLAADLLAATPAEVRFADTAQWTSGIFVGGVGAGLTARFW